MCTENGLIERKFIIEAKGILQAEGEKLFKFARRPSHPAMKLDFEAIDYKTGKKVFVDHKTIIDFQTLKNQGRDISRYPTHEQVAYNIGKSIPIQKKRYIGVETGPTSMDQIVHLVNLENMKPSEKPSLISAVLQGAEDAGSSEGIIFINFE